MQGGHVATAKVAAAYSGERTVLGDVLVPDEEVPESYYVEDDKLEAWRYLKGRKSEPRVNKKTGFEYRYSEGAMAFPDALDAPARTILTNEGGGLPHGPSISSRHPMVATAAWCPTSWTSYRASRRAGRIPA